MVEPRISGTSILVIDDEPQIRRLVKNALEASAERVSDAGTAREGLDIAAAEGNTGNPGTAVAGFTPDLRKSEWRFW